MSADPTTQDVTMTLPGMPEGFRFPTGEEIYDGIMGKIEPELLNANLPHLDEPYAGETEAEHAARYERYSRSFATYKTEYQKWVGNLRHAVSVYKQAVMHAAEGAEMEQETELLKHLEEEIHLS
jgi:hypothetical protein